MKIVRQGSVATSGTMLRIGPASCEKLTESQFLREQRDLARRAIARASRQIVHDLGHAVNPAQWTRSFPWSSVGAAAIAGFISACAVVPSRKQQALRKLAALERAVASSAPGTAAPTPSSDKRGGLWQFVARLLLETIRVLRPVVASLISARLAEGRQDNGQSKPGRGAPAQPAVSE